MNLKKLFVKQFKAYNMTALETLNWYKNLFYDSKKQDTVEGVMAKIIGELLQNPKIKEQLTSEPASPKKPSKSE